MNQSLKFGLVLGSICLMATLVLSATYEITKPRIDREMKKEEDAALKMIAPDADSFSAVKNKNGIEYFEAYKKNDVIGYCLKQTAQGYGGRIRLVIGVTKDGNITGVQILEHYETPGLGSKVAEQPFLRQFNGKNAAGVEIRRNIDAITGATISSKAVTDAIRKTVDLFLGGSKG